MKTALVAAAALAAAAVPLAAQETPARQPQERVHVVQQGETLWDLARVYLSDPFLWPEIFRLNTDVVEDPALIYPTERLRLPDGVVAVRRSPDGRTVFYRDQNQADREIRGGARMDYPVVTQGDFYRASFVARDGEVATMGRLVELVHATQAGMSEAPGIQIYDRVFVTLEPGSEAREGDRIHFLRPGRDLTRAGRVWTSTGIGTVAAREGDVATVVIVRMFDRVMVGDLAAPYARFPVRAGVRPVESTGLQGSILGFQNAHPVQATEEIAFLDVGRQAGVKEGDEFVAYLPRQERDWGTRPEVAVARLQVVRVTEGTASARITGIQQPAIAVGLPVRRVARMP